MQQFPERIIDFLIAWRLPAAAVAVVLAAVAFMAVGEMEFDRSIENMFAPNDPLVARYEKLKRTFGGNEIVMVVYRDDGLLDPDASGTLRLVDISEKLAEIPGVRATVSLDQPLGPEEIVSPDNPQAAKLRDLLQGYTHGADGRTVAVVCMLEPEANSTSPRRQDTIDALRAAAGQLPEGMIAGEPVMVADGFRYLEADGRKLGWATTLLLGAVVILCFRSIRWVVVPILVVQFALLLTRATLVWSGLRLSMVSSMLTAIVTVVGVAAVIHVIVRFQEARSGGLTPKDALRASGRLLAGPIFWAAATTAVGFAALLVAQVAPVRDFGVMMAIGALAVLVSMALVTPTVVLLGRIDVDPRHAWGERRLDSALARIASLAAWRPKTIAVAALLLSAVAAVGAFRLEVETDFTRNFRRGSPIVQSYAFVEENLGGAGVWDVVLPAPEQLDWPYFTKIQRLEERLRSEVMVTVDDGRRVPGLTNVLSIGDALMAGAPRDLARERRRNQQVMVRVGLRQMRSRIPALMDVLHAEDPETPGQYYYRIMLRAAERQPSSEKRRMIQQVEQICREEFPEQTTEVTGFYVLLTNLIDSMLRDQWLAFGVAVAGIALMMLVAFRSPTLAAVTLVPNILPIVVVTGLMGWAGLKINMGAAMIAAVSMGLSIDSSIHYVTSFRRALVGGHSVDEALRQSHQTVGRAMVFSTLGLIAGFSVLATSQFVPTIYFGLLVSLTMLGGLAGNLIVLPVLLRLALPGKPSHPTSQPENGISQ